jgi:ferrous iron transport protein B
MGLPLIVNLNMMDMAQGHGLEIDIAALETLGSPCSPTSMKKGQVRRRF